MTNPMINMWATRACPSPGTKLKRLRWQLSLVFAEGGHWWALAVIAILAFNFPESLDKMGPGSWGLVGVATIFILFFLRPILSLYINLPRWREELNKKFPTLQGLNVSYLKFWWPLSRQQKTMKRTFLYSEVDSVKLLLDLYLPKRPRSKKLPFVVLFHGGGWDSGNREQLWRLNRYLAARDIAVAAVDYRLSPQWKWPAAKNDGDHAIKFLKGNAEKLGLDPDRYALMGRSAGGQIAQVLAYAKHDPALKGCVYYYAPSDMNVAYDLGREDDVIRSRGLVRNYLGGTPAEAPLGYTEGSGLTYVTSASPPTLQIHGKKDSLVGLVHSENLKNKLDVAQVRNSLVVLPWAQHGFDFYLAGPGGQMSRVATLQFLRNIFSETENTIIPTAD